VLAASLAALAGWFGVGGTLGDALLFSNSTPALGSRALACAAVIMAWRYTDRRTRPHTPFSDVFDHFAANLAFWGAIAWCLEWPWLAIGLPLLVALAFASVRRGLDTGREAFLVYGIVYAAIGTCAAVVPQLHGMTTKFGFVLVVVCAAAATLWQLRRRLREPGP
jgi:bacteriorhodopsin